MQEPVRCFVAALGPSEDGGDAVVAVELAVPMLCVCARGKRTANHTKGYCQQGAEILGYEWCEDMARLYESTGGCCGCILLSDDGPGQVGRCATCAGPLPVSA